MMVALAQTPFQLLYIRYELIPSIKIPALLCGQWSSYSVITMRFDQDITLTRINHQFLTRIPTASFLLFELLTFEFG